jgi:hypothetical protein
MSLRILSLSALLAFTFTPSLPVSAQEATSTPAAPGTQTVKMPEFKQPVFVTDVGQGNTARLVEVMLRRSSNNIEFKSEPLGKPEQMGDAKTLLIGVGGSTKGLGAAGLDAAAETARMTALIDAAKKAGMPVIGVHMGGMPRRGELSDTFNRQVFEKSDLFILWEGGNEDGFFTRLEQAKKDPSASPKLVIVEKKPEVGQELEKYFSAGGGAKAGAAGHTTGTKTE